VDVGWVMTAFGLGSVLGSWLGGLFTDKLGAYKVMVSSLLLSSVLFVLLQYLESFEAICLGVFLVITAADMFRPAVMVALGSYSSAENRTRSVTLIRLAINLGFAAGPAAGGLIIATIGYGGLFWVDGITCLFAGIVLLRTLHPKKRTNTTIEEVKENPQSAYKDLTYWVFFAGMALFGFVFLQLFSTVPLFYKDVVLLDEKEIGLLMGLNGLMIFLIEMPLVKFLEGKPLNSLNIIITGGVLVGLSFLLFNISTSVSVIILSVVLVTLGEMFAFPFSNSFAINRSKRGKSGQYMALYMIAFSVAHILGHNTGMQLINWKGYTFTWYAMSGVMFICILLFFWLSKRVKIENKVLSAQKVKS
jgi:predicted MFS family arabinose efflux permease